MNWNILNQPDNPTILNPGIELSPADPVLKAFIIGMDVHCFPELLNGVAASTGYSNQLSVYKPYSAMDEEDRVNAGNLDEDEVEIYHQVFGTTKMNEAEFDLLIHEYAKKLLDIYGNNGQVQADYQRWLAAKTDASYFNREHYMRYNPGWAVEMEEGIRRVKNKLS